MLQMRNALVMTGSARLQMRDALVLTSSARLQIRDALVLRLTAYAGAGRSLQFFEVLT